jgi:hypothetical protein
MQPIKRRYSMTIPSCGGVAETHREFPRADHNAGLELHELFGRGDREL